MDDNREIDQVLMSVRNNIGGVIMVSSITAQISFKLLVYLLRLAKKGLLAARSADSFKAFTKLSEGNFTVYNIPLTKEKAVTMRWLNELELKLESEKNPLKRRRIQKDIKELEKTIPELEQLNKINVSHCVLPKLNGSDQTIQVAVAKKDDQLFKNWFLNHLTSSLAGGEKQMEELKVFTEGNYTIFNIPFEGKELDAILPDFETLGINYSILPDLKIGDGNSQIAVANADRNKLEVWAQMWKEKQIQEGKEPGAVYAMDQESYMNTGTMEANDYIQSSDPSYREVDQEFEAQSQGIPWKAPLKKDNTEEFVRLNGDANFEKISINKESLVENMDVSAKAEEMRANGYFISRIPGTYGKYQETLLIPSSRVFITDAEQTYVAFLPKNEPSLVADAAGKVSEYGFQEICKPYQKVERGFGEVKSLAKDIPLKKEVIPVKAAAGVLPITPKL